MDNETNNKPIDAILREDRKKVDQEVIDNLKEYHKIMTYIGAAALGFFLTIHEKLFQIQDGRYQWVFIGSVSALFLSLVLSLINLYKDYRCASRLRETMDAYIKENIDDMPSEQQEEKEQVLLTIYRTGAKLGMWIAFFRFVFLLIGLGAEVQFVSVNLSASSEKKEQPQHIRIEIPWKQNATIDTSNPKQILINN